MVDSSLKRAENWTEKWTKNPGLSKNSARGLQGRSCQLRSKYD